MIFFNFWYKINPARSTSSPTPIKKRICPLASLDATRAYVKSPDLRKQFCYALQISYLPLLNLQNITMSTRYKVHNQNHTYFLTLTTVGWVDVFTRKEYRDILIDSLRYCQEQKGLQLYAYVIMSNHIHLMASAKEPHKLTDILRDFKKFTANKIKNEIRNSGKESRREWLDRLLQWFSALSFRP
jgi:REP element-mobilizing transposase RayT